jgi:succinyl-diaminopimelate desuccinylase
VTATDAPATDLERLALELLAIPSVTGEEAAIREFCDDWLRRRGVYGLTRAGDSLAVQPRPFREGVPRLLLLGHLDTVPASGDNAPRLDGDCIRGLGASDMKCADALILQLVADAVARQPRYDLAAVLYAREEGAFAASGLPEILAAAPGCASGVDLAVAMEPTDNGIELGCLGTLHARVTFHGKRAHSARPWQGENAIHMAAPLLSRLAGLPPRDVDFAGLRFREVCSATKVEFEGAANVVPGSCALNLNFRFAPDREPEEAEGWVEALVREAVPDLWRQGKVTCEVRDLCPAGRVCAENPLLASLMAAAGEGIETRAKQAWTDVGRLSNMGIDAVNFGPGLTAQAHQKGEFASRRLLAEARQTCSRWLFGAE